MRQPYPYNEVGNRNQLRKKAGKRLESLGGYHSKLLRRRLLQCHTWHGWNRSMMVVCSSRYMGDEEAMAMRTPHTSEMTFQKRAT